ncbi:MAG: ABC transporter substrate-binding protein [Chitinispirillaceae bacterium]
MRRFVGALLAGGLLIFAMGCGNGSSKDTSKQVKSTGTQNSYEALQEKAENFTPSIGKPGGEIIISSFSDPKSFNPITSTETSTSEFTNNMYEGLTTVDGVTLEVEPNLAERWETSEDGLSWTFYMRPGVKWSDGTPLSAYDVEFTFNDLIYNPDISPNSSRDIFTLEGKQIKVKALDSTKVQFKLPIPFAPFLRSLSQEILPKHKFAETVENKTFTTALDIRTRSQDMVVNGPWTLDSYESGQKVVLKKNRRYWKKDAEGNSLPYLDRLVYILVSDQNAQLLKFKQGEIDYLGAKGEDYPGLKKDERSGYTVYRLGPATGSSFLFFNQNMDKDSETGKPYVDPVKLKWFRNENFRKAIAHSIDKEAMISIVMNGLGYPQRSSKTPAEGYFYNPDVKQYPYDPDKALDILGREGFSDKDGDGVLEDSEGNRLEFSLITNSGNNIRIKIAEMIRKDLQDLGIKVHFRQLEFNSLIQKMDVPPYDYDAILMGLTGGVEPHFGKNVWHSSGTLHMWYPRQKKPSTEWEARIDSIFEAAGRELDREKRKELYDEWQRIAADKQPLIYTVLPERIQCLWDKFGNVNPSINGGLLHNLEYLYTK